MKLAIRRLARSPGLAIAGILIAAVSVGAATAIFSAVNALVLRPLALPEPDRLAAVYETNLSRGLTAFDASVPNYVDWRDRSASWESLAAVRPVSMNLVGDTEPELVHVLLATSNFLPTVGVPLVLGRGFTIDEDRPGGGHAAIFSTPFWRGHFGGRTDVIGSTIELDGGSYTVVGVAAPASLTELSSDILVPMAADSSREDRMDHNLSVYGRLRRGVTLVQAEAEMKALAAQVLAKEPEEERGWSTHLVPLAADLVGPGVRSNLYVLLVAVGVLLLIGCANLSSLMLVRTSAQAHELAIRRALGATRGTIASQLVTDSLMITLTGGILGIVIALWLVDALRSLPLPRASEISIDFRVLAVASAASLLAGLLAGVGPAIRATRLNPQEALKHRAPRSGRRPRLQDSMVVAQLALSLTLLVGATMLARSFWRLLQVNPGFNPEHVLTLSVRPDERSAAEFYDALDREVAALPGVISEGSISLLPLTAGSTENNIYPVGPSRISPGATVQATWRLIHGNYFASMQIPLLRGSDFTALTPKQARSSMIVSASLARMLWGDEDPVGRKILRAGSVFNVVGVVGDVRSEQLGVSPRPAFYMSVHRFTFGPQTLVVRSNGEVAPLVAAVRKAISGIAPTVPVFGIRSMIDVRSGSLYQLRFVIALMGGFAGVALLLSMLGVYGTVAFNVQGRRVEIGTRMAIGALPRDILGLLMGQSLYLALLSLVLGLAGAVAGSRVLSGFAYETHSFDLASFAIAGITLTLVTLVATLIPALRATRIHPIEALRAD